MKILNSNLITNISSTIRNHLLTSSKNIKTHPSPNMDVTSHRRLFQKDGIGLSQTGKATQLVIMSHGWCCQLTDLVYDGVFEVLQWLLFLSAVPPVQLLTGWCVTAKAPPDISAISALTAVKHGNCSSLTPLLNPVRTRKSLIWPWMALDAGQLPALWALASTRFYVT